MEPKYKHWRARNLHNPETIDGARDLILESRNYAPRDKLDYGDFGLQDISKVIFKALKEGKKIALYADYDVDGTMSCVSWVWFLKEIGYENFTHYIPCRFREGYGVNLEAIKKLIHEYHADVIITMDTGITANAEASYARSQGVTFICTDHHVIQPEKIPDAYILNPKLHTDPEYQELCGCGITFVLLRKLGAMFPGLLQRNAFWQDLVALAGIATICDVVPLNSVNHKLAKLGVQAFIKSQRPILKKLREACSISLAEEKDVGFRIGPRINAVGRMDHAEHVVQAFVEEDPGPLISVMEKCNDQRKKIQDHVFQEAHARISASAQNRLTLFTGGDWHPGVLGIAASKVVEQFWRPTWLFQKANGVCKGSARSIEGFNVTAAMSEAADLFTKFGGHAAAGGFTFPEEMEETIAAKLEEFAARHLEKNPTLWESKLDYDFELPLDLATFDLVDALEELKPFGHGFLEPRFKLRGDIAHIEYLRDKKSGEKKHTALYLSVADERKKIMFFNSVLTPQKNQCEVIATVSSQIFRSERQLQLFGVDLRDQS